MAKTFYNYDKLYSYNAVFNFLVGARGLGKTYGAKKKAIKAALEKGDEFIYLRRYKTELTTARNTFFADIEHEFPEHDFRVNGGLAQASHVSGREDKKRDWQTIGYFATLSTAQTQKSVAFPNVKLIIFDEFIIEKGALHYLPDEVTIFNNFYSTVDRYKDKTKVLFLANGISIMNPYFIEHEIRPEEDKEFIVKADGFIVAHFPNAEIFQSEVFESRFGKFIRNTAYAEYAVGNVIGDNHEFLLKLKDSRAKYQFTLEVKNGAFSVWMNPFTMEYFIQAKRPKNELIFTMVTEKMDTNKVFITYSERPIAYLRSAFRNGRVMFDKAMTRNTFSEIFKR